MADDSTELGETLIGVNSDRLGDKFVNEFNHLLSVNGIADSDEINAFRTNWQKKINELCNPINFVATGMGPAMTEGIKVLGPMLKNVTSIFEKQGSSAVTMQLIEKLTAKIDSLQEEVDQLREENRKLKESFDELQKSPGRSPSLVAREAMRTLENFVVLKIMGSKRQMKKNYVWDFEDLKKVGRDGEIFKYLDPRYKDLIAYYKKQGNAIHTVSFTKEELHAALIFDYSDDSDNDNEEEKAALKDQTEAEAKYLCETLEKFAYEFKKKFGVSPLNE